jgi:transposase InsO family protein
VKYVPSTHSLNPLEILHVRLNHINEQQLKEVVRNQSVIGLGYDYNDIKNLSLPMCDACMKGKMKALATPPSISSNSYLPFELLSLDTVFFNTLSYRKYKYVALYVDKCTRKLFAYPMKHKSELVNTLKQIISEYDPVRYPSISKLKVILTDCATESMSSNFMKVLKDNSITLQTSAPYKHQQNFV